MTRKNLVFLSLLAIGCGKTADAEEAPRAKSSAPAAERALALGSPAPDVTLPLQDGFRLALLGMKGKVVVLYFCSHDEDPACLATARGLSAHYRELHATNRIVVVGVSGDDAATHRAVIAREKLPFDLASDADGQVARAFALPSHDHDPVTVVVGRDAKIRAVWSTSEPTAQAAQILAAAHVTVAGEPGGGDSVAN